MEILIKPIEHLVELILAIGALIGAFHILRTAMKKLDKDVNKKIIIGIVILLIGTGIIIEIWMSAPPPLNARLTRDAWKAYNKGKYELAIKKAEECIDEFGPSASRMQECLEVCDCLLHLETNGSAVGKTMIMSRGLLSDVGTCWFIKGRSLEKLNRNPEAINAYERSAFYTYARTYGPINGSFWSPAQSARDRMFSIQMK